MTFSAHRVCPRLHHPLHRHEEPEVRQALRKGLRSEDHPVQDPHEEGLLTKQIS